MTEPPAFIDRESWEAFHDMRKRIKAPLTPYAEKLVIRELVKLKCSGHDPQACLDQSIMLSWRDVYPPRDKGLSRSQSDDTQRYLAQKADEARQSVPPPAKVLELAKRLKVG